MEKGDTVFFHPLLIHGSGRNKSQGFRKVCIHITALSEDERVRNKSAMIYSKLKDLWLLTKLPFSLVYLAGNIFASVTLSCSQQQGARGPQDPSLLNIHGIASEWELTYLEAASLWFQRQKQRQTYQIRTSGMCTAHIRGTFVIFLLLGKILLIAKEGLNWPPGNQIWPCFSPLSLSVFNFMISVLTLKTDIISHKFPDFLRL